MPRERGHDDDRETGEPPPTFRAAPPTGGLLESRRTEAVATEAAATAARARWEALPEADRSAIRARVERANPAFVGKEPFLAAMCHAEMDSRSVVHPSPTAPTSTPRVEVLPTDKEVGVLASLANAHDPFMRTIARDLLRSMGRDDVFRPGWDKKEPAGKPLKTLPAGSKQPT